MILHWSSLRYSCWKMEKGVCPGDILICLKVATIPSYKLPFLTFAFITYPSSLYRSKYQIWLKYCFTISFENGTKQLLIDERGLGIIGIKQKNNPILAKGTRSFHEEKTALTRRIIATHQVLVQPLAEELSLESWFPTLICYLAQKGGHPWNLKFRRNVTEAEIDECFRLSNTLSFVKLVGKEDFWVWNIDKKGFSIKSLSIIFSSSSPHAREDLYNMILYYVQE